LTQGRLGVPDRLADNRFEDLHHRTDRFRTDLHGGVEGVAHTVGQLCRRIERGDADIQASQLRWSSS